MTFSITGRCEDTGMFGVAITTSSICVGSRCPWARAGVGAVATQNVTLPSIGRMVLDEMVYDPETQSGAFNAQIVKGVFSFVSGDLAKTSPDAMVLHTPTSTIGIPPRFSPWQTVQEPSDSARCSPRAMSSGSSLATI